MSRHRYQSCRSDFNFFRFNFTSWDANGQTSEAGVCASLVFAFCVCASLVPRFHPFSPPRSYNPAAFSAANPIKRKKLVRRWVLLYWVSKPERSSVIKTTLLSLLLIIPSSEAQHIGILLSTTLLTHFSGPTENMVSSVKINMHPKWFLRKLFPQIV